MGSVLSMRQLSSLQDDIRAMIDNVDQGKRRLEVMLEFGAIAPNQYAIYQARLDEMSRTLNDSLNRVRGTIN